MPPGLPTIVIHLRVPVFGMDGTYADFVEWMPFDPTNQIAQRSAGAEQILKAQMQFLE